MSSTQVAQIDAERTTAGVTTQSWDNLLLNVQDFLNVGDRVVIDAWFEQRASTRQGLNSMILYILYRDVSDETDTNVPAYVVTGNTDGQDAPTWFAATTDALGADARGIILLSADTIPQSNDQNGKLYLWIYVDTSGPAAAAPGEAYLGTVGVAPLPPGGSGDVDLQASDGTVIGTKTVYNLDTANAAAAGELLYVWSDPITERLVTLARCCP